jgi:hypothetical protein
MAGMAFAENIPAGVGGNPLSEFAATPGANAPMVMVMSPTGGPIPIHIDPSAPRWQKRITIGPDSFPLTPPVLLPGTVIPIWEKIQLLPPPDGTTIPRLPFTDWHEHIHPLDPPIPGDPPGGFSWLGGRLVIHNPNDPNPNDPVLPPLVDVPGMVDPLDPSSIWFGPWPNAPFPAGPNGLHLWIHKELVYNGPAITAFPAGGIVVDIWEWPTVPEPTTLVLAGLGGLALLAVRRRRS